MATLRLSILAPAMIAVLSTNALAGYGHWLELKLDNPDSIQVTFEITKVSCLNTRGSPEQQRVSKRVSVGNRFVVAPGQSVVLGFNHDPASACDGVPADFSLKVNDNDQLVYFRAYENGDITLNPDYPDSPYTGRVFQRDGRGASEGGRWLWQPQFSLLIAGKSVGHWELLCSFPCNKVTLTTVTTSSETNKKENSREKTSAFSTSAEAGIEFEGVGSAKVTVTKSEERKVGVMIGREISSGSSAAKAVEVPLPQGMHSLWQWVVSTTLSRGSEKLIHHSSRYTCTPTQESPRYLPDSPEDMKTCPRTL